jgi:hypothetical protein
MLSFVLAEFARSLYLNRWSESLKNIMTFSAFIGNAIDSTVYIDPEDSFNIQCIQKVAVHLGVWVAISRRCIVGPWTSLPAPFISAQ